MGTDVQLPVELHCFGERKWYAYGGLVRCCHVAMRDAPAVHLLAWLRQELIEFHLSCGTQSAPAQQRLRKTRVPAQAR